MNERVKGMPLELLCGGQNIGSEGQKQRDELRGYSSQAGAAAEAWGRGSSGGGHGGLSEGRGDRICGRLRWTA